MSCALHRWSALHGQSSVPGSVLKAHVSGLTQRFSLAAHELPERQRHWLSPAHSPLGHASPKPASPRAQVLLAAQARSVPHRSPEPHEQPSQAHLAASASGQQRMAKTTGALHAEPPLQRDVIAALSARTTSSVTPLVNEPALSLSLPEPSHELGNGSGN